MAIHVGMPAPVADFVQPPEAAAGHGWWRQALPLVLAAVLVYLPLQGLPFLADDYLSLERPSVWWSLRSTLFRPLDGLLLAAQRAAFGLHPLPYHLLALGLHAAVVLCAWMLLARLAGRRTALLATMLFLLYPRSIEAVAWVSAADNELPYSLGVLLALLLWTSPRPFLRRWRGPLVALLYLLALSAKQSAVVLPAAIVLLEAMAWNQGEGGWRGVAARARARLRDLWPVGAVFVAYALLEGLQLNLAYHTPGHAQYGLVHPKELLHYIVEYPILGLLPFISAHWLQPARHAVLLAAPVALLFLRWLRAGGLRRTGALWFAVFSLPTLLFAPFGPSDEYFYLPALGICLAVAEELALLRVPARRRLAMITVFAVMACTFGWQVAWWREQGSALRTVRGATLAAARSQPGGTVLLVGVGEDPRLTFPLMNALPAMVQVLAPQFRGQVRITAGGLSICGGPPVPVGEGAWVCAAAPPG